MAGLNRYPDRYNANMDEWREIVWGLENFSKGLLLLNVGNIDAKGIPNIKTGSIFVVNGSIYRCTTDESIGGTAVNDSQNYIYAVPAPNGLSVSFSYAATEPQWNAAKGGWYNNNNRAIVKLFCTGGLYNNKVILDRYDAMNAVNTRQAIPEIDATGFPPGVFVFGRGSPDETTEVTTPSDTSYSLLPGMYRYELRGGNGGAAGAGGIAASGPMFVTDGNPGEAGASSVAIDGTFFHFGGLVRVHVGNDGGNGGNGGKGKASKSAVNAYGGAGGGGGGGLDSFIGSIAASGGRPGRGGAGRGSQRSTTPEEYLISHGNGGNGGIGIGGNGADGNGAEGDVGGLGGAMKSTTHGYARLWRVG